MLGIIVAGAKTPLQRQLEKQKFLNTIDHIRQAAKGPKALTTSELARINRLIAGLSDEADPWRVDPVKVQFGGREAHFNLMSNPVSRAREIFSDASQIAGNNDPLEAAFHVYSQLVLSHVFKQANRRTAVAAALWILSHADLECDAEELLNLPLGDLRQEAAKTALRNGLAQVIKT